MLQETESEDTQDKLSDLRKEEKTRKEKIERLEKEITKTKKELADPPATEPMEDIESDIVRLRTDSKRIRIDSRRFLSERTLKSSMD